MLVKTPPGLKCPMEGQPRKYITDDVKGTQVPDTVFYHRLVAEGSLILCKEESAASATASVAQVAPAALVTQPTAAPAAAPAPGAPASPGTGAASAAPAAPEKNEGGNGQ